MLYFKGLTMSKDLIIFSIWILAVCLIQQEYTVMFIVLAFIYLISKISAGFK